MRGCGRGALTSLAVAALLGACSESAPQDRAAGRFGSVGEILAVLESDGISCDNLVVRDADDIEKARAAEPEWTPPPGAIALEPAELPVRESGLCQLEGSPRVGGRRIGSRVIVYEDDEHLSAIDDRGLPGHALVYGDNWEIQLTNVGLADRIAALLDGEVVPPNEETFARSDLAAIPPQCFLSAALPPGLRRAERELGVDGRGEYARFFGESLYYMGERVQAAATRSCRRGLDMEAAVRRDDPVLGTAGFAGFWADLCDHSFLNPVVIEEVGLAESFSHEEFAQRVTRRFLGETSLSAGVRRALERRCERALAPPSP